MARRRGPARARTRLSDALSRPVPRGQRALHRVHAGGPGGVEVADGAAGAGDPDRRIFDAAAGCRGRPHPARSCAGNVRRSGTAAARSVARAGAVRPADRGDPESPRRMDTHRRDAVRPWPALFARADHATAAADLVHPDRLGRGAVHAAGRRRLVPALGAGMGAGGRSAVAAICRRAHRGGEQAGLSRDPRASRAGAADPVAAAGAGAVVDARGSRVVAIVVPANVGTIGEGSG